MVIKDFNNDDITNDVLAMFYTVHMRLVNDLEGRLGISLRVSPHLVELHVFSFEEGFNCSVVKITVWGGDLFQKENKVALERLTYLHESTEGYDKLMLKNIQLV